MSLLRRQHRRNKRQDRSCNGIKLDDSYSSSPSVDPNKPEPRRNPQGVRITTKKYFNYSKGIPSTESTKEAQLAATLSEYELSSLARFLTVWVMRVFSRLCNTTRSSCHMLTRRKNWPWAIVIQINAGRKWGKLRTKLEWTPCGLA